MEIWNKSYHIHIKKEIGKDIEPFLNNEKQKKKRVHVRE